MTDRIFDFKPARFLSSQLTRRSDTDGIRLPHLSTVVRGVRFIDDSSVPNIARTRRGAVWRIAACVRVTVRPEIARIEAERRCLPTDAAERLRETEERRWGIRSLRILLCVYRDSIFFQKLVRNEEWKAVYRSAGVRTGQAILLR